MNVQVTKTKLVTATINKQKISVVQSQALAQVVVHASFSTIAYARDLFSDNCFRLKTQTDLLSLQNYENYVQTAERITSRPTDNPGRAGYETLIRGQETVVDGLLEQMRNAFWAVEQQILKTLIFNISLDSTKPENIIESYAFTFTYRKNANGTSVVDSLCVNGVPGSLTFGDAKSDLHDMLNAVNRSLRNKPRLPSQRCIWLSLIYNDNYDGVRVPGFCNDPNGVAMGHALGWTRIESDPDDSTYDAGFRGVAFICSRLQPNSDGKERDDMTCIIPSNRLHYAPSSLETLIDNNLESRIDQKRHKKAIAQAAVAQASREAAQNVVKAGRPQQKKKPNGTQPSQLPSQINSQMSTQHKEDFNARAGFDRLANCPPEVTNDGDTQPIIPRARKHPVPATRDILAAKVHWDTRVIDLLEGLVAPSPAETIVACQCDCNDDAQSLMLCHICKRYQHTICYGFLDSEDPRRPAEHICYQCLCLLVNADHMLLKELREMARTRKVAGALMGGKHRTVTTVTKAIKGTADTTKRICDKLVHDGYLKKARNKNYDYLNIVNARLGELKGTLFDPTSKITQYLAIPSVAQLQDTAFTSSDTIPAPPPLNLDQNTPGGKGKRSGSDVVNDRETPVSKRMKTKRSRGQVFDILRVYPDEDEPADEDLYDADTQYAQSAAPKDKAMSATMRMAL